MNWFKENPFLSGLTTLTAVAAAALGYLIFQSLTAYTEASDAYAGAVSKLHTLQNKVPFPSEANLKAMQGAIEGYSAKIRDLQTQLARMEVPLDPSITPQQFQDGLRAAVNDLRAKAETNGVGLPANFYFGFDQYQTQVPTEQAAPALYRQFRVIQSLVARLVDFRVASIDGIVRPPLPEEGAAKSPAPAKKANAEEPVFQRFPFDVSFTAEQGEVRVAFNSLLGPEQFLIVRSVSIQNSSPQAPVKAAAENAAQANPFAAGTDKPAEKKSLQVILGRELIKATLRLEMLDFSEPAAPKK